MLIQEKVNQAKQLLEEFTIDCWITFVRESQLNGDPILPYLVSADVTWHSAFIVSRSGETRAIVGLYDQKTVEDTGAWDQVDSFVEGVKAPFISYMRELNPSSIAVNYSVDSEICDGITHGMLLTLQELLGEIGMANRLISAEPIVSALRERKTESELDAIRAAIQNTEEIFDLVTPFIKPGRTEKEIAAFMKAEVERRGLELSWEEMVCPAVFTGPATAGAHYEPTDREVERGHILNMDFGVRVDGYCSDMQRTFYILKEGETAAPADVLDGFDTIVKAVTDSFNAMHPGAVAKDIDKVARDVVVDGGYDEFPHALGHQVGRFSHDGTAILGPMWEKYRSKPLRKLEQDMVFTIEPRLTVEDRGVATIEEMVVITSDGADFLSHQQTEIILIG
ncbi:MAG: aminopeptidase P family protein [bacterium]|nr:aminopeptidase P family protein [bacterium]